MQTHAQIDDRSLALAREIVAKIDADPLHRGLARARAVCSRWRAVHDLAVLDEWAGILNRPWGEVRAILLDSSDDGKRLRQSSPFCGVLSPRERWAVYRRYRTRDASPA